MSSCRRHHQHFWQHLVIITFKIAFIIFIIPVISLVYIYHHCHHVIATVNIFGGIAVTMVIITVNFALTIVNIAVIVVIITVNLSEMGE